MDMVLCDEKVINGIFTFKGQACWWDTNKGGRARRFQGCNGGYEGDCGVIRIKYLKHRASVLGLLVRTPTRAGQGRNIIVVLLTIFHRSFRLIPPVVGGSPPTTLFYSIKNRIWNPWASQNYFDLFHKMHSSRCWCPTNNLILFNQNRICNP